MLLKKNIPTPMQSLMQVNSFVKHQVIYDFSLLLGVTTSIIILLSCSLHAHLMVQFPISHHYVGSISDVKLTRVSGLIAKLPRNNGASVMADRVSQYEIS